MTTPIFNKRTAVKSVFGTYTIKEDETDLVFTPDDDSTYDFILRDPQYKSIQNEIVQAQNYSLIQFDPKTYLENKRKDIIDIADKLKAKYIEDFTQLLKESFTESEAKKMALEQSQKRKEFLMNIHKKKFPKDQSYFKDKL